MKPEQLKTEIGEIIDRNSELGDMVDGKDRFIGKLKETIRELNREIDGDHHKISAQNEGIERQNKEIERLGTLLSEARADVSIKRLREDHKAFGRLEAELSARKEDSETLMKVVKIIEDDSVSNTKAANLIADVWLSRCAREPECRRNIIIRVLAQEESIGSQLDEIREMIQLGEVALKADPSDVDVKEGLYCLRKRERSLRMSLGETKE